MALPTELTRTAKAPRPSFARQIGGQLVDALRLPQMNCANVQITHDGGTWVICFQHQGEHYRVPIMQEQDFIQLTDPNPYEEPS
jgi:hypothetical protein